MERVCETDPVLVNSARQPSVRSLRELSPARRFRSSGSGVTPDRVSSPRATVPRLSVVGAVVVALAVGGCLSNGDPEPSPTPTAPAEDTTTGLGKPHESGPCQPWIRCPTASFLRRLLERAGYEVTGETGSAFIVTGHGNNGFYASASSLDDLRRAEEAGNIAKLEDGGYQPVGKIEGVLVSADNVRLTWDTSKHRVWVQAGPTPSDRRPSLEQISDLVSATKDW